MAGKTRGPEWLERSTIGGLLLAAAFYFWRDMIHEATTSKWAWAFLAAVTAAGFWALVPFTAEELVGGIADGVRRIRRAARGKPENDGG